MPRTVETPDPRLQRLLELYSVQKLSDHFGSEEKTKHNIIEDILESSSPDDIAEFAYLHHSTTKHHVHLFEHKSVNPSRLSSDPLALPHLAKRESSRQETIWFYLVELSYDVFLREPTESTTIDFLWPVRIRSTPEILEFAFTIMEKNLSSRYPEGRVVRAIRTLEERAVEARVLGNLDLEDLRIADLNRGVKSLWQDDMIDSASVGWKKARSTSRESMDKDSLLRRDDQELFQQLLDKPLFGAIFKWVGGGDVSIDHFAVDATQGTLTFRTFSDLGTGADYVVREILRRN